jgi:lipid A disaccharide synthetase
MTELVNLLTMEDVLTLFPGSERAEIERHWTMMRTAILGAGKGDDAEFITMMLGTTIPEAKARGMKDGDAIEGDFVMSRIDTVRQLLERRRLERERAH